MTDALFQTIASTGVVGVFLVLAMLALIKRDKELTILRDAHAKELAELRDAHAKQLSDDAKAAARQATEDAKAFARELALEKQNRIEDAKAFNGLAMALQKEVITAVGRLGEIVEAWEERAEADRRAIPSGVRR